MTEITNPTVDQLVEETEGGHDNILKYKFQTNSW